MTPEQFQRAASVFLIAREYAPADRTALLERECGGDSVVRRQVERMLKADSRLMGSSHRSSNGDFVRNPSSESRACFLESASLDVLKPPLRLEPVSPTTLDDPYPPGSRIGEYTMVRRLGEGGMGRVYDAQAKYAMP